MVENFVRGQLSQSTAEVRFEWEPHYGHRFR
jgi:hypothetical protein